MWIICLQMIHMNFQVLFSLNYNKNKFRMSSALRAKASGITADVALSEVKILDNFLSVLHQVILEAVSTFVVWLPVLLSGFYLGLCW